MAKAKTSALPATLPQEPEPVSADPVKMTLSDAYWQAGNQGLSRMLALLGIEVDVEKLADVEWLRDPEHRRIAQVLLKLTSIQQNIALGVVSGQLKFGDRMREDREKETHRQATLEKLRSMLQGGSEE